jgi:hypothetical protein
VSPPAHLTIFVGCHQLVDLLIGPRSQNLNETLLISTDSLEKNRGVLAKKGRQGSWSGLGLVTPSTQGAPTSALRRQ